MAGLPTYYASILSEHALEEIEMGAIGRLLALTGNDEVNSLAALHFGEVFGRVDTYQLAPIALGSTRRETSGEVIRGRQLFDEHASHSELNDRMVAGAVIKKTGLTNEFDYHAFVDAMVPRPYYCRLSRRTVLWYLIRRTNLWHLNLGTR